MLLEFTGAAKPHPVKFDGISIRRLLDSATDLRDWPHDRMLVTDSQRVRDPINGQSQTRPIMPCRYCQTSASFEQPLI